MLENKIAKEIKSPIRPLKGHNNIWDELNKSINEMKQKIAEKLNLAKKVQSRASSTERSMKKAKSSRKLAQSPYASKPMLAHYNERKKLQKSGSRKRLCENCFKLLSKGFSLVDCSCRKALHR
eukprot:TRINITY_DN15137_c0_g1_i1.p1 TRINITY_DN15137_c0_g1~~TRINITY_DN15137_c0_g1_i1.p1  ORF type:complete len:123 (+),score=10.02 TRINITY_DN15137_c0_g1_i1:140-508(+)